MDTKVKVAPPPGAPKVEFEHFTRLSSFSLLFEYVKNHGYIICPAEQMKAMAIAMAESKVVELGSGTGTLGNLLRQEGVDITLTDIGEEGMAMYGFESPVQMDIYAKMEDVDLSPYDIVLLTWPPYEDPCCEQVLKNMRPGSILFYCGEGQGGCTGTDAFHDMLYNGIKGFKGSVQRFEFLEEFCDHLNENHVRWNGIHDRWSVYKKSF